MKVGEAKTGSSKKFFKMEDGDNVYRILPALGELADKGIWSKYYKICWGYKNQEGRMKLFQDCREVSRETGMVEVESAAYLKSQRLKEEQLKSVERFKAGQATQEEVKAAREQAMRYNIEGKHYVNAVNLQGEIGLLKIGHKAKLQLDDLIKRLREQENKNPLAIENGLYVNFYRSGKGRDTSYQVYLYKQKVQAEVNGKMTLIEQEVSHTMDSSFIARLDQEAFELNNMFPAPSAKEIEAIVNGSPEVLDSVISNLKGTPKASNSKVEAKAVDAKAIGGQPELKASPETHSKSESSDKAAESLADSEVSKSVSTDSEEMSNEDFLKSIGAL